MASPDFINDLIRRDPIQALARIMEVNPLPGITGRLCFHPCQSKCLRRGLDSHVQIQMLERYLADRAPEPSLREPEHLEASVLVLGAGPVGLSAAYFLGRMGISVTVRDPLDQPGGFLVSVNHDLLSGETLARETTRLVRLANIRFIPGDDVSTLDPGGTMGDWRLIIHDQTAHAKDSAPAKSLTGLAGRLSLGRPWLDTTEVCRDAYKASQIALAVADGRELAVQALNRLGFYRQSEALKEVGSSGQTESAISAEDIRYELFDRQDPVDAGAKGLTFSDEQALAEAKRCISCGHCNSCGRCLVFCPDVSLSIAAQGTKPEVDEMHCKGCGICAYECPRRAIEMER